MTRSAPSLLRIPPFPGASLRDFTDSAPSQSPVDAGELVSMMVAARVGGAYWGTQPRLPAHHRLIAVRNGGLRAKLAADLGAHAFFSCDPAETYDPWHLVSGATEAIVDADDELALVASMAGVPVRCIGEGRFSGLSSGETPESVLHEQLAGRAFVDPFSGPRIDARQAVDLCAFWRKLIDSNRDIDRAFGIARWKRPTVAPLLWNGAGSIRFGGPVEGRGGAAAVWRSRVRGATLQELNTGRDRIIEVEDGFIRSSGLGADCIPPQSIIVDRRGIYFDPAKDSDLEHILQEGDFTPELLKRARELRELIVSRGISKYEASGPVSSAKLGTGQSILVPGQVEDDRAVILGGCGLTSNLELLRRVRRRAPHAHILYKPHPDVEAGHRKGAIRDEDCLGVANDIVRSGPISHLIEGVDEVHVNTSLAGFEALLRGKPVVTYGVPFYAGWGLTRDEGPVPDRRCARRTLDELVAAALILYPRYVDPKTGLPCPPEVLVNRLAEGSADVAASGPLVWARRLQGQAKRQLARLAK